MVNFFKIHNPNWNTPLNKKELPSNVSRVPNHGNQSCKKRRLIEEENKRNGRRRDRFSDLPDEISHHILSFLPMKSIAQVSATSKRWRSLWASFPILDFSERWNNILLDRAGCSEEPILGISSSNFEPLPLSPKAGDLRVADPMQCG
ncbi:Protein with RNI-like/FBD-like domains [Prunus dulcis]|uniref:Protein with RNI-like/FBD-like domains n=1 Tax=Prunus dulcis TaxID=3755 RepID=A0A4Y1R7Q8_PRUDU|nr:Protein with RNI-like/FBD-like domains [Prunus dulcis]